MIKKFLLTPFLLAAFIGFLYMLQVSSASVENNNSCLPENLVQELEIKGENILLLSTSTLKDKIEQTYSCAHVKSVTKGYPSNIKITLEENIPVAQISNTLLALTQNGEVIEYKGEKNIPKINLENRNDLKAGDTIYDSNVVQAALIAKFLLKSDFNTQSIRIISGQIAAYAKDDLVVIFSVEKDAEEQVNSLQQVLAKAKISESKIGKIDLSFSKPVIQYK